MKRTLGSLLGAVWNKDRFAHIKDVAVSDAMVYRVAQLSLVGWTFCGASFEPTIELERDDVISTIDVNGDIRTETIL